MAVGVARDGAHRAMARRGVVVTCRSAGAELLELGEATLGHEVGVVNLFDSPLLELGSCGLGEEHVRRALHNRASDVDGVLRRREAAGGAAGAVAKHETAIERRRAVERERGAVGAVEAGGVFHDVDGRDDGFLGRRTSRKLGISRLNRASEGSFGL